MPAGDEEALVCRICLESEGELVSPCPCRGSQRGVHLACLERWHVSQRRWALRCMTCKLPYTGGAALRLARTLWHHLRDAVEHDPARLSVANDLALVLAEQGELSEAARIHRETLEVRRCVLGAEHPNTLTSAGNLASLLE